MGGRGGNSGLKTQTTTLDEYLGKRGLSSPVSDFMMDKMRIPHGLTQRQRKQLEKEADKARVEYSEKREAAIREYREKVKYGSIKEKSRTEVLIERANGHPDNESTQAARRILEKRGIEWRRRKKK